MGYSPNRALVTQNLDLLQGILSAVSKGEELRVSVPTEDFSSFQYTVNRILYSAQIFRDIFGGKFAPLREMVRMKTLPIENAIIFKPTGVKHSTLRRTVNDALSSIPSLKGNICAFEFFEDKNFSFSSPPDRERLKDTLSSIGWILYPNPVKGEDGLLSFVIEREEKEETSGFNLLSKYKSPL